MLSAEEVKNKSLEIPGRALTENMEPLWQRTMFAPRRVEISCATGEECCGMLWNVEECCGKRGTTAANPTPLPGKWKFIRIFLMFTYFKKIDTFESSHV